MCAAAAAAIKIAPVGDSFTAGVVSGDRTAALRPCQTVASVLSVCGDDGPAGRLCRRNPGMYVSGQSDRAGQCQPAGMPTHRSLPCHRNPLLTSAAGRLCAFIIKYIFPNRWPGDIRTTAGAPAGRYAADPVFKGRPMIASILLIATLFLFTGYADRPAGPGPGIAPMVNAGYYAIVETGDTIRVTGTALDDGAVMRHEWHFEGAGGFLRRSPAGTELFGTISAKEICAVRVDFSGAGVAGRRLIMIP